MYNTYLSMIGQIMYVMRLITIVFNIDKKAMLDKSANVIFKTREEKEFKKSDSYRASTTAFNGYNAFRAVANKIVEKYFKKEFK